MVEAFELKLPSGDIARISIWRSVFRRACYFARIIPVRKISARNNYATILKAGHKTVYYTNPVKLKTDLIAFYGV